MESRFESSPKLFSESVMPTPPKPATLWLRIFWLEFAEAFDLLDLHSALYGKSFIWSAFDTLRVDRSLLLLLRFAPKTCITVSFLLPEILLVLLVSIELLKTFWPACVERVYSASMSENPECTEPCLVKLTFLEAWDELAANSLKLPSSPQFAGNFFVK